MGPFPARATDVDVVRDLMIHDIDINQRLVGEEPERVESIGVPVITEKVDIWQMGCLMLELFCRSAPFEKCTTVQHIATELLVRKRINAIFH